MPASISRQQPPPSPSSTSCLLTHPEHGSRIIACSLSLALVSLPFSLSNSQLARYNLSFSGDRSMWGAAAELATLFIRGRRENISPLAADPSALWRSTCGHVLLVASMQPLMCSQQCLWHGPRRAHQGKYLPTSERMQLRHLLPLTRNPAASFIQSSY